MTDAKRDVDLSEDVYATRKKIVFALDQLIAFEEKLGRPARILDFGCGNAEQLGKYVVGHGRTYVGVDMHDPSLDHAKSICLEPDTEFLNDIPVDQMFDVILVSEVLEHLDDPVGILKQLTKQLDENGLVIGSIPNGYGLTEIEKFVIHKTGLYTFARCVYRAVKKMLGKDIAAQDLQSEGLPYNHASGHVQFYTKGAITSVLKAADLHITAFQNGSVMGADLSGSTFLRGPLIKWNTKLAACLPNWAAATWHFAAEIRR